MGDGNLVESKRSPEFLLISGFEILGLALENLDVGRQRPDGIQKLCEFFGHGRVVVGSTEISQGSALTVTVHIGGSEVLSGRLFR